MKKLILLIVPVLLLLSSCNNPNSNPPATNPKTDTTPAPVDTPKPAGSTVSGTGGSPAQVFVDATGVGIPGVLVTANNGKSNVGTGTTNSSGIYTISGLVNKTTYTFTPSIAGYTGKPVQGTYDGTNNSLPPLPMTKNQ